ncbi:MAG: hypothetical protein MUF15_05745 [Acidobacteria bacterium]|jgi:hypothetical protein|nr:hypothetical protein [Acidobacteriota bacterium]
MSKIIYFSRLIPLENRGGGCRRLLQVYELLKKIYLDVELIYPDGEVASQFREHYFYKPFQKSYSITKWSNDHQNMVKRLEQYSRLWKKSVSQLKNLDFVVMDDPVYFLPLFKKLIRMGIPVIAICHNIESLVPGQANNNCAQELLKKELEILAQCRLVITISREEDIILRNFGISSRFIPYYPVQSIEKRLLAIRENREQTTKNDVLMVGTSKNFPTREGMIKAAAYWHEKKLEKSAGKLIVGGFFSEDYLDSMPIGESVACHWTFSNQELDAWMARVRACLCYQERGAGALTRICEMLIAGVPVLANTQAARSYYHVKGLYEFTELGQLAEVLTKIDAMDGDIPLPPAPDIVSLEMELKKAIN